MITERALKKWRKEALSEIIYIRTKAIDYSQLKRETEHQERILRMTQELLDQHLLKRKD